MSKLSNKQIREVIHESYNDYAKNNDYCLDQGMASDDLSFQEWLILELEQCPESFDCFFRSSWDDLNYSQREERIREIKIICRY